MISRSSVVVFILMALLPLAPAVHSETWHVPSDCTTIHTAIALATSGDTVLVAPGTYSVNDDPETWISLKPGLELISEDGAQATVIQFCGYPIGVELAEGTMLSGFTISFVKGSGPECEDYSIPKRGVYSWSCTNAIVESCVIENCDAGIEVGGTSSEWAKPVFRGNTIRGCDYGVICNRIIGYGSPLLQDNIITECHRGADVESSSPIFDHNEITHCLILGLLFFGNCTGNCSRNTIAFNGMGVDVWADPPLGAPTFNGEWEPAQANYFHSNTGLDMRYNHPAGYCGMTAIWNYWGSDCPDFDHKIEGEINYSPWTDSTHTKALTDKDCPGATQPTTWGAIKAIYR
jgi:hypothetical protein